MHIIRPALKLLLCLCFLPLSRAQEVTISVGAVTKYSGIATDENDIKDIKSINEFLNTLESQVAKEFVNDPEVDYLDRMNMEAIFRELHLTSNSNFDASSGALPGLLGRLDFLIVIDATEPSTARIRLIDVQSGAVKAIESCTQRSWLMSLAAQGPPDCVAPFVSHSVAIMRVKKGAKEQRARQQAAAELTAQQKSDAERAAAQKQAALEQQREQEQTAAQAKAQANAALDAKKVAEQEAAAQAQITERLTSLKPALDDAISRLSAHNDFWHDLSKQLASTGQSLRPSISSTLKTANVDSGRCQQLYDARNPDEVHECVTRLDSDLEKLDKFKD
jgi:flagellar biosynthesis GTPase FlhF